MHLHTEVQVACPIGVLRRCRMSTHAPSATLRRPDPVVVDLMGHRTNRHQAHPTYPVAVVAGHPCRDPPGSVRALPDLRGCLQRHRARRVAGPVTAGTRAGSLAPLQTAAARDAHAPGEVAVGPVEHRTGWHSLRGSALQAWRSRQQWSGASAPCFDLPCVRQTQRAACGRATFAPRPGDPCRHVLHRCVVRWRRMACRAGRIQT